MVNFCTTNDICKRTSRAHLRRRQIVDAAASCFIRDGFHAASMSEIAREAGMSVGHIYRYFSGKEAIIEAIVQLHVETILEDLPEIKATPAATRASLVDHVLGAACGREQHWAAMMIEVRAEAARNGAIAKMVRNADVELKRHFREIMVAGFEPGQVPFDIDDRMAMIPMAIEGINLRMIAFPDTSKTASEALIRAVIAAAFAVAPTVTD